MLVYAGIDGVLLLRQLRPRVALYCQLILLMTFSALSPHVIEVHGHILCARPNFKSD